MRYLVMIILLFCSCVNTTREQHAENETSKDAPAPSEPDVIDQPAKDTVKNAEKLTYENKRFRNVTIQKQSRNTYTVSGEGQIFEASFNWIIEDGHNELDSGYTTTDAGAPEWGKFSFTVKAPKHRPNSTLHLVLFEISARDGSRTHELPIPLN